MNPPGASLLLFVSILVASAAFAGGDDAACDRDSTPLHSGSDMALTICHAPYTRIDRSRLDQWQNCDDAIIHITLKASGETRPYVACSPVVPKQFMVRGHSLLLRHFFAEYPGFEKQPSLIESLDLTTRKTKYEFITRFARHSRKDIDNVIQQIDATVAEPFDGATYFPRVYGGLYKLRDYAMTDPPFTLSTLRRYKQSGVFDGEVAETLSEVIAEAELIHAAIQQE